MDTGRIRMSLKSKKPSVCLISIVMQAGPDLPWRMYVDWCSRFIRSEALSVPQCHRTEEKMIQICKKIKFYHWYQPLAK